MRAMLRVLRLGMGIVNEKPKSEALRSFLSWVTQSTCLPTASIHFPYPKTIKDVVAFLIYVNRKNMHLLIAPHLKISSICRQGMHAAHTGLIFLNVSSAGTVLQ